MRRMTTYHFELIDGPLAGQVVTVTTWRGEHWPNPIYVHAPLPRDHVGEPGPRHQYGRVAAGYVHTDACACLSGTHGVRVDVDTPEPRG